MFPPRFLLFARDCWPASLSHGKCPGLIMVTQFLLGSMRNSTFNTFASINEYVITSRENTFRSVRIPHLALPIHKYPRL